MTLDRLALLPLLVGHLSLFVVLVNVVHGLGYSEKAMSRAKILLFAGFGAATAVLAWEFARGSVAAWSWPTLLYAGLCLLTGLVFFPLVTAYLHLRPQPEGLEARWTEVDLAAAHEGGREAFVGEGRNAWLLRLPGNESLRLRKVEWDVTLPGLPPALDGLTILHLTDLHLSRAFDRRFFETVFDEVESFESDLLLFTGDLVDDDAAADWVVPLFSRVRGRVGTYGILGNHDMKHHPAQVVRHLEEAGVTSVEAGWASLEHQGVRIVLGGTSYPWGAPLTPEGRPEGDFRILLSHAPDQFYWAERSGFDLMLSGHNHGGQIRLPVVGSVFMPSLYSRRFDRGFFRRNGLTLHVSQGVAGMHPVRYGCVPEIGRLVLRSPSHRPAGLHDVRLASARV